MNGFAEFSNIEIYEGDFITQNFTVDTSLFNQRYILDNSFIDTSTIKVKVKNHHLQHHQSLINKLITLLELHQHQILTYYKKLKMKDMN